MDDLRDRLGAAMKVKTLNEVAADYPADKQAELDQVNDQVIGLCHQFGVPFEAADQSGLLMTLIDKGLVDLLEVRKATLVFMNAVMKTAEPLVQAEVQRRADERLKNFPADGKH